jgi:metal-responsive CopG/Arc/MetJ family transcriptional regulator
MATAVKKTISLPPDLAELVEDLARTEGKTVSGVVQDALRMAQRTRLKEQYRGIQGYWCDLAQEKGILSEADLKRYLDD